MMMRIGKQTKFKVFICTLSYYLHFHNDLFSFQTANLSQNVGHMKNLMECLIINIFRVITKMLSKVIQKSLLRFSASHSFYKANTLELPINKSEEIYTKNKQLMDEVNAKYSSILSQV